MKPLIKKFINKNAKGKRAGTEKEKRFFFKNSFKYIRNMKIAPKILAGFFIIAALVTGMGLYNSTILNQVDSSSSQMYKGTLLPLNSVSAISDSFQKECVNLRDLLLIDDESLTVAHISQINTAKQKTSSAVQMIDSLVASDSQATANVEKLKNALANYDSKLAAALQSIQNGNKADVESDLSHAGDLYNAEKMVSTAVDSLNTTLSLKAQTEDTFNRANAATVQNNTWILMGIILFLSLFIGINTARSISRPIKKITNAVKMLADGNTEIPGDDIDSNNEIGQMGSAYKSILSSIQKLEKDTGVLIKAATEGQLTFRADADQHKGAYRKIIEGFNQTLDAVTQPVYEAADVLGEISRGNLEKLVTGDFKGDYSLIKDSLNMTIDKLNGLISDTDILIEAALEGHLALRVDPEKHQGAYSKIIKGFNATLDAVILPIKEAVQVLQEVSKGNLDVSITGDFKGDHAIIKEALNTTVASLKGYVGEISSVLGEMANGNLNVSITSEYLGDFVELKDSINNIIDSLNSMLSEINSASDQITIGTRQLSDGAQLISVGATEQAGSIEELTASLTDIAKQTDQNAGSSKKSNQMSLKAKEAAAQCNEQMQEMLKAMNEINGSANNISKIIKVIDDIAFQTNILALNAAIEAARAGFHGKGFAVVAEEVRELAARSANAAKETAELIEKSIKKIYAGSTIANETAEGLTYIITNVDQAFELGEKIVTASREQASGIAQINQGLEQVSQVVQNNSATAQESAAASQELSNQADQFKKKIEVFKLKV